MTAVNNLNLNAPIGPKSSGDTEYLSAGKNTSLMGAAMVTMDSIMLLFTELANTKFEQMSKKTEVSRDAQDMANRIDALLAGLASGKDTAELPADVIAYMRANNIEVNGQSIDEFLSDKKSEILGAGLQDHINELTREYYQKSGDYYNRNENDERSNEKKAALDDISERLRRAKAGDIDVKLDKADLTAVKSALESHSGRASDFVQQNQLKLQQLMQNFNTAVTMANSVQSMNAESTKSIAQSIR